MGWQEAMEEENGIDRRALSDGLRHVRETDQHQKDERQRREKCVERQRAGEEWDVVFVSRLKSTGKKAGGRSKPAAGP